MDKNKINVCYTLVLHNIIIKVAYVLLLQGCEFGDIWRYIRCQTVNIFDPRHAHFVHGRSRITCMYMLSALSSDGGQGEYSRTHVPH